MISALVTISIATSETARCCTYGEADAAAPSPVRGPPSATGGGDGEGAEDGECPGGGCPGGSALSYGSAAAAFAPATPAPPPPLPAEEGTQTPRQYTVAGSEDGVAVAAATPSAADGSSVVEGHAPPERDTWDSFPPYIKTTSTLLCAIILGVGVAGNVMVPLVILRSRDMRNSTNVFLVNLSVADLLVLLLCTPTLLVEVHSRPEVWVLGPHMCKAVPFVELTVAHASVLTILAISFERYYAICEPLKAGYVCTKGRAFLLCLLSWAVAAVFTSPILMLPEYNSSHEYYDGSRVPACFLEVKDTLPAAFFLVTMTLFFFLPFAVLLVLYSVIARHLMLAGPRKAGGGDSSCAAAAGDGAAVRALVRATLGNTVRGGATLRGGSSVHGGSGSGRGGGGGGGAGDGASVRRSRRQVVMMLGTVVASFFVCLFPFRILTLVVITKDVGALGSLGADTYYPLVLGCRLLIYIHSALNPCLYSLMSSKFRRGFARLFCTWRRGRKLRRCYRMRSAGDYVVGSELGGTLRNGASSSPLAASTKSYSFSRTFRSSRGKSLKAEVAKLSTLEEAASGGEARSSEAAAAGAAVVVAGSCAVPSLPKASVLVDQVVAGGEIFL
ncbi:growth hormone secretagogue receptor type 1-like isoform X2 [Ischnura elegans]|uniref:growth hormone secretagogue receptor type 1-like isoform X2 n=1 Tax=Ischnura elegans TaxID=197161 RepID=UPI001ED87AF9|nr:growth hormone secretagogue receptor type 1-like isoform X2 [Ischnura elegans]